MAMQFPLYTETTRADGDRRPHSYDFVVSCRRADVADIVTAIRQVQTADLLDEIACFVDITDAPDDIGEVVAFDCVGMIDFEAGDAFDAQAFFAQVRKALGAGSGDATLEQAGVVFSTWRGSANNVADDREKLPALT